MNAGDYVPRTLTRPYRYRLAGQSRGDSRPAERPPGARRDSRLQFAHRPLGEARREMSDIDVPQPDAAEQSLAIVDPYIPPADLPDDAEAPEADALEQALPAPIDEDDARR